MCPGHHRPAERRCQDAEAASRNTRAPAMPERNSLAVPKTGRDGTNHWQCTLGAVEEADKRALGAAQIRDRSNRKTMPHVKASSDALRLSASILVIGGPAQQPNLLTTLTPTSAGITKHASRCPLVAEAQSNTVEALASRRENSPSFRPHPPISPANGLKISHVRHLLWCLSNDLVKRANCSVVRTKPASQTIGFAQNCIAMSYERVIQHAV